jgi:hypothetical protein
MQQEIWGKSIGFLRFSISIYNISPQILVATPEARTARMDPRVDSTGVPWFGV